MLSDWSYKNAFDEEMAQKKLQLEHQREMFRHQMELMRWKEELERQVPYSAPLTFEQKIDKTIELLEKYGPKLAMLADVLGAMHLDEDQEKK